MFVQPSSAVASQTAVLLAEAPAARSVVVDFVLSRIPSILKVEKPVGLSDTRKRKSSAEVDPIEFFAVLFSRVATLLGSNPVAFVSIGIQVCDYCCRRWRAVLKSLFLAGLSVFELCGRPTPC
jgi:hypothetical protein